MALIGKYTRKLPDSSQSTINFLFWLYVIWKLAVAKIHDREVCQIYRSYKDSGGVLDKV